MTPRSRIISLTFILYCCFANVILCKAQSTVLDASPQDPPDDQSILSFSKSEAWVDTTWRERYEELMLKEGEIAPDFTLHTTDGQQFNFYNELEKGKPILLLTASHSCPAARGNIKSMKKFARRFKRDLAVVVVYTLEAHPVDTVSPYSIKNKIWVTKANEKENILVDNPKTYVERKDICEYWQKKYKLKPTVLVDNPSNNFWLSYGQAPNLAYLVNTNKEVFSRQIFMDSEELEQQIDKLISKK